MYLGKPGNLVTLPDPKPGVTMTAERPSSVSQTLAGRRRVAYSGLFAPRTFELSWGGGPNYLTPAQYDILESFYMGQRGNGPWAFMPYSMYGTWNYLDPRPVLWVIGFAGATWHSYTPTSLWTTGYPTNPGMQWSFQAELASSTTSNAVTPSLHWYDAAGVLIGSPTAGTAATPTPSTHGLLKVQGTAPSGAAFVAPYLDVTATAANTYTVIAAQLEMGLTYTTPLTGRGYPIVTFDSLTLVTEHSYEISAEATLLELG